jgi:flagellar hook-associated protein 3 FlgL
MRISTTQYFTMNVQTMDDQQSALSTMYSQISSGQRIQTASDDPLGAAQAVTLSAQSATLAQYAANQNSALTSLQTEDSTMGSIVSVMQSIQQTLAAVNNGSLTDANRSAFATTLQSDRTQLMTLANTTDSSGNFIFSGFQSGTQPFSNNASGVGATYEGDAGQPSVQISGSRTINVSDTGSSVFQSVSANEALPVPSGASTNTGTGTIGTVTMSDSTNPGNADTYQITFGTTGSGTSATSTYTVTDLATNTVVVPATAYTAGTDISFAGESVAISGTPAAGDSFTVAPANTGNVADTDIFATLDNIVSALQQPASSPTGSANLTNALATASAKIGNTYNNMLSVQASVGGREQELTATQTAMETTSTQTSTTLVNLTGVNMTSAISQFELTQTSLKAAQQAFSQVAQLSLFNFIGGGSGG